MHEEPTSRIGNVKPTSADDLEASAHELIAEGHRRLALAARARSRHATPPDLVDVLTALPLPRRTLLAACRAGELRARKVGRRWLATKEDLEAFVDARTKQVATPQDWDEEVDGRVARRLGLRAAGGAR